MTLGFVCILLGLLLVYAGVKGESVTGLIVGRHSPTPNQQVNG